MEHVPETTAEAQGRMAYARCRTCLYSAPAQAGKLECHFKPPAISGYTWPVVAEMDWCGEYVPQRPRGSA